MHPEAHFNRRPCLAGLRGDEMNSRILQGLIDSEPPREEGKHRFMGGTCVDCGHPLDEICTANLNLSPTEKGFCESVLPGKKNRRPCLAGRREGVGMHDVVFMIETCTRKSGKSAWPEKWFLTGITLQNREMAVFLATLRQAKRESRGADVNGKFGPQLVKYRVSEWHRELSDTEFKERINTHAARVFDRADSEAEVILTSALGNRSISEHELLEGTSGAAR